MVLDGFRKDNYVIQVHESLPSLDEIKDNIHGSLKTDGGIVVPTFPLCEFEEAVVTWERSLLAVPWVDFGFPVAGGCFKHQKYGFLPQRVNRLVHTRKK